MTKVSSCPIIVKKNQPVVFIALEGDWSHLKGRLPHIVIYIYNGGQTKRSGDDAGLRPDWAGVKSSRVAFSESNTNIRDLLLGDTKFSIKWKSAKIERGRVKKSLEKHNWLLPLSQIYSHRVKANVRYGYIITDKGLVIVRVRPSEQSDFGSEIPIYTTGTTLGGDAS